MSDAHALDTAITSAIIAIGWSLRMTERRKFVFLAFLGMLVVGVLVYLFLDSAWLFYVTAILELVGVLGVYMMLRPEVSAWESEASSGGLCLQAPFTGRWIVAAGGPYPGSNHHMWASDQRFAYDFIGFGASYGKPILAPCSGIVSSVHDGEADLEPSNNPAGRVPKGRELGNYVCIKADEAFIFLCHLQRESICVLQGQNIEAGTQIGSCGNSGRTTSAHLHIHAQDRANYALDEAVGVPLRFCGKRGSMRILRKGSMLQGSR